MTTRRKLDPADPLNPDHPLNVAVRAISVFKHWPEMQEHMARGYIPTLRVDDNAAPTELLKAQTEQVIEACARAGLRYYAPEYDPLPAAEPDPVVQS